MYRAGDEAVPGAGAVPGVACRSITGVERDGFVDVLWEGEEAAIRTSMRELSLEPGSSVSGAMTARSVGVVAEKGPSSRSLLEEKFQALLGSERFNADPVWRQELEDGIHRLLRSIEGKFPSNPSAEDVLSKVAVLSISNPGLDALLTNIDLQGMCPEHLEKLHADLDSSKNIEELNWKELHPDVNSVPKHASFGMVFKARRQIGRKVLTDVSVKVLHHNQLQNDKAVLDLKKEAITIQKASNGIINNFVVKLHGIVSGPLPTAWKEIFVKYDFSFSESPPNSEMMALVMEYEGGGNLEDLLHRSHDHVWHGDTRERIRLLMEVSTGLWHLHFNPIYCIIHGDIKPANVLLSGDQGNTNALHIRLADFGLSSVENVATCKNCNSPVINTSEERGSWAYLAPEIYNGCKASVSSDVYALGTLIYEVWYNVTPVNFLN